MTKAKQKLLQARKVAQDAAQALLAAGEAREDGKLTADELVTLAKYRDEMKAIDEQASVQDAIEQAVRAAPAATAPESGAVNARVTLDAGDRKFNSLGEQLRAIACASSPRGAFNGAGDFDPRLNASLVSGGASANVGSDGSFAIQKEFATDVLASSIEGSDLLSKADSHEVGPNSDGLEVVYLDETSRATGSRYGGVQVYRAAEADAGTAKKPKVGKWECRLEDIIGLAYMTDRLLQDAPSMANLFKTAFAEEFRFVAENEMVRGSGVGQMLGILNADVTVSQAKETGQDADTIVAENVIKMWSRVHPRSQAAGSWFYNVECLPQLLQMQIGTGTSAQLVFMPPSGISGSPYGTIYGRPAIPIEYASGIGDVGDIFFADWSRFKVITKGGLQSDESIHVRFTTNERAFRWITRINGAPKDKSALTPFKGTGTLSPFVTLAAR